MGVLSVVALGLLTAACGTNETQRAATGGLTGLGVGALAGGPLGAVVGGVVGAGAGSLMPEGADQLANNLVNKEHAVASSGLQNMGVSTRGSAVAANNTSSAMASSGSSMPNNMSRDTVRQVQQQLKADNLYRGHVDGIVGPLTRQALVAFQQEHNLQQTASIDQPTLSALNIKESQTAGNRTGRNHQATSQSGTSTAPMMTEQQIQNQLQSEGYSDVADLHQMNDNTYGAQATKNGTTYNLQIDAENGRIVSQQEASNTSGSGSSSTMPPSQGSSMQNSTTNSTTQGSSTTTGSAGNSSTGGASTSGSSSTGNTGTGGTTR